MSFTKPGHLYTIRVKVFNPLIKLILEFSAEIRLNNEYDLIGIHILYIKLTYNYILFICIYAHASLCNLSITVS